MERHRRGIRVLSDLKKGSLLEAGLARVEQGVRTAALAAPASIGKQTQGRVKGTSPLTWPGLGGNNQNWDMRVPGTPSAIGQHLCLLDSAGRGRCRVRCSVGTCHTGS